MTSASREERIAKYKDLLSLALAQIQAIDAYDQNKLGRIIEQKWVIIRTLTGTKELLLEEPSLADTIKKIRDADQLAERKLAARMGQVQTKLYQINKQNSAKRAYVQSARKKHPIFGLTIDDTTPRFFDIQS